MIQNNPRTFDWIILNKIWLFCEECFCECSNGIKQQRVIFEVTWSQIAKNYTFKLTNV